MKLTKREIDRIVPPNSGQVIYWDDDLKGFGMRVTPSRMSYIAQGRVQGRTVRVTLGPHGPLTPDAARSAARSCLGDMARGIDPNLQERRERLRGVTLEQAFRAYLKARPLGTTTRRDYVRAMGGTFAGWKTLPLTNITGGMVRQLFERISLRSPAQANQHFRFLRALLGWAMWRFSDDQGAPLMPTNACEILTKLKLWNRVDRRTHHLAPYQLKTFLTALALVADDGNSRQATKDLCALLLLTGLREQEGCRLKWADVDLCRSQITIQHTKNHRVHILPIGPWLASRLAIRASKPNSGDFVFPADNRSGHLRFHRSHVLAIGKAAGIDFRLHDLRRTFAGIVNHHLERTFSAYTIKRLLNHSTLGDVTAGYIQIPVETLREPIEMVERFVLQSAGLTSGAGIDSIASVSRAGLMDHARVAAIA